MRVAKTIKRSRANGPGERFVIWVAGCSKRCPGCYNPELWDYDGPHKHWWTYEVPPKFENIRQSGVEGVTFTGGEPFDQPDLRFFTAYARNVGLSVVVFTGYTPAELLRLGRNAAKALSYIDILVVGPYDQNQPTEEPLLGSSNQEVIFLSNHYGPEDIAALPSEEHHIDGDSVVTTGFPEEN